MKIAFLSSQSPAAKAALKKLTALYGQSPLEKATVIVALGGDGFMLQTLHETRGSGLPVYGMNCGTVGFLMNARKSEGLPERIQSADEEVIHPLIMRAETMEGARAEALAINEVSLFRMGPQAARLKISIDGRARLEELVCDGALVATPAGSTAYNYSAHGPILPIGADVLALTAVAAFRPRRWRGALLPKNALVRFDVLDPVKRPVMADADGRRSVPHVRWVEVSEETAVRHRILFDKGHGLDERLLQEQFA